MAKLNKTQTNELMNVLRLLMKDNNGGAYNALSDFYVKYAPTDSK